jgi:membrane protein YdbS with pleckstrin-like domain
MAYKEAKKQSVIIKKSPIVIVKNFILLQLVAMGAFFLVSILTNYAQLYRTLPLNKLISFRIAEFLFVFVCETAIIFFIFFRWYKEHYRIQQEQITHTKGILYHRHISVPFEHIASVTYDQGPLAKLTKYGTIKLKSQTGELLIMKDVPDPQDNVELILELKNTASRLAKTVPSKDVPDVAELISKGEDEHLEFKSSFRWDIREKKINKNLEKAIMKTVAAFLNSHGGRLIIGVDDTKNVLGLESDLATLSRQDADGFENHFSHIFNSMIGAEFRQFVSLVWSKIDGKDCCLISVSPAAKPVYLKTDSSEEFFIRTGNGTTSLKFSEASSYVNSHWKEESRTI